MVSAWRWKWPACAAAAWAAACLTVAVLAYFHPRAHTVFDIYAIASRAWCAGEDMFPRQAETHELYRYSPAFAVATAPLAFLPPGIGNALWKLLNAGVFAAGLWAWCRRGVPVRPTADRLAALFLVALPAAISSLYIGQANLMMTGFVLLGLTAVAEDRWWWAASYLAAATLIKVFPLALAMVLAVLFWRTFPLRFAAALAVGLLLPLAAQRPEYAAGQTAQWFHHVTESVELNRDRLRSLDKMLELSGAPVEPKLFLLLGAAAGGCVLAVALWTRSRGGDRREVLFRLAGWFLAWAVLFGPSTEDVTFAILAPAVAWAVVDAFGRPGAWPRRLWLLESLYLMGLSGGDPGVPVRALFGEFCWTTVGAVMFQLVLVADLVSPRARPRTVQPATTDPAFGPARAA